MSENLHPVDALMRLNTKVALFMDLVAGRNNIDLGEDALSGLYFMLSNLGEELVRIQQDIENSSKNTCGCS